MGTPLKEKLFMAASANAGLQALLGTNPFQWADQQLEQAWNLSTLGAITVFLVSNPRSYEVRGQMATSWNRVQFTVYGYGRDSTNASAIVAALIEFLWSFFAYQAGSTATQAANQILSDRDGGIAETQPMTYMRFVDAMILNDESI
jgi:hypothetical protein